ncbi:LysR family transcriptional regulator [Klebsiella michiganensis]|nr:LysR family transcriptional regulator [Klebsiella michiganensis]
MRATSEEIAIFVAVVESGSFSRAAEQLGQANSAVSRAVKKLESKLGVSLLNRTTRQLSLTEEGERYFRRMQVVLQEMVPLPKMNFWRVVRRQEDYYGLMPRRR